MMPQPQDNGAVPRSGKWAFFLRLAITLSVASVIDFASVYGIFIALGARVSSPFRVTILVAIMNLLMLFVFTLLGETPIEDALKSLVILLIAVMIAKQFGPVWAMPLGVFIGAAVAMISNAYSRRLQEKFLSESAEKNRTDEI